MYASTRILLLSALAAACVVACATGGSGASGGDDQPKVDASKQDGPGDGPTTPVDSPMTPVDAAPMIDAPVDSGGTQLFCTSNAQCTVPGECCVDLGGPMGFCAPGTIILGECFPFD
jgi:hypothetical protein